MSKPPTSLSNPDLHKKWSDAKSATKKAVKVLDKKSKSKTQGDAFSALESKSFKHDLGPNLDRWIKAYPDWKKMSDFSAKIDSALTAYAKAVKQSALDPKLQKTLLAELKSIAGSQGKRVQLAEQLISSDVELAIKNSKKKVPPPIVVFKHPDIRRAVLSQAGKLSSVALDKKAMSIEVIIGDADILSRFPEGKDYNNASQKIVNAGNFSKLIGDIADALKQADKNVTAGKSLSGEAKTFAGKVDQAVDDATKRAVVEAARLGGLKANARWANAKRGGKLVLSFAGAAAGVAGLALTPFTFGVSTVAGCVGLAKAGVEIGKQLADYASTCEMMANGIAKDLNTLKKQYGKWLASPEVKKAGGVSNKMGMAELSKRGLNAIAPTFVTNLKSVKDDIGTYEEKVNNLEVQADKIAEEISSWLTQQGEADKAFKKIQSLGRDALTDKETKVLLAVLKNLKNTSTIVQALFNKTTAMNKRVSTNRVDAKKLAQQFSGISVKNPLWSEVGSTLFEASSSVAFALAGNVNAPDTYSFAKDAMSIVSALDTAREQISNAEELANGLHDAYKARKDRIKS